jgi:hypothetical protein
MKRNDWEEYKNYIREKRRDTERSVEYYKEQKRRIGEPLLKKVCVHGLGTWR